MKANVDLQGTSPFMTPLRAFGNDAADSSERISAPDSHQVMSSESIHAGKIVRRWAIGWLLSGWLMGGCISSPPRVLDLDGKPCDPLAANGSAATVLIFVSDDCPMANRYIPEIQRLQEAYASHGARFWMVHADPGESAPAIREHDRKFDLTIPALRDPRHDLVKQSRVEVTPAAALFAPGGTLVYHGRIDDRVTELGQERPSPAHRDLAAALGALLAGRAAPVAATQAVGCFIPAAR
jgi:hypothetical protein